jgi:hypothetical protein
VNNGNIICTCQLMMLVSFKQDCSISSGGNGGVGGSISHNFGWVGVDSYSSSYADVFDKRRSMEDQEEAAAEIETLPLFPMHGDDGINGFCNMKPSSGGYYTGWYRSGDDGNSGSRTSLELSLNSYSRRS